MTESFVEREVALDQGACHDCSAVDHGVVGEAKVVQNCLVK